MEFHFHRQCSLRISAISLALLLNCLIVVAQNNFVSTYAGTGTSGLINGDTATCRFKSPDGMCMDKFGNIFIADGDNDVIRKITPAGIVSTYAGSGEAGYLDGPDSLAQFLSPFDVCADDAGNIYVSDFENQYIRKISVDGMVSTVAGNGIAGYVDGPGTAAEFNYPRGIVIDADKNLYIGDSWNHRIRKIDADGNVTTYAGGGNIFGVQSVSEFKDGNDTSARFYTPCGLSIDAGGNIFVADAYNHRVRKIDPARVVTTVAGSGGSGSTAGGFADGAAEVSRLNTVTEVFVTDDQRIFIGDTYNNRVRMLENGMVTTVAGNGSPGLVNGIDTLSKFNHPRGLVLDASGDHLYVCDGNNRVIRKIVFDVTIGIDETELNNQVSVFPNPSTGKIIVSKNLIKGNILITDIFGKEILSRVCNQSPMEIDLENLPDGIYLLQVISEKEIVSTQRIIISH